MPTLKKSRKAKRKAAIKQSAKRKVSRKRKSSKRKVSRKRKRCPPGCANRKPNKKKKFRLEHGEVIADNIYTLDFIPSDYKYDQWRGYEGQRVKVLELGGHGNNYATLQLVSNGSSLNNMRFPLSSLK